MHVFTEKLPRKRPPEGECQECEHTFQPHEGPQTPRQYAFTTREVAAALVKVGEGQTYRSAGYFARRRAERLKVSTSGYKYATKHPNAVLDWVEVFAPSIYGRYSPKRWPEMLILDHAPFHIAKQHPSGYPKQSGKLAFCVFGAVGYERGRSPRVWKLAAYPTPTRANWIDFLSSLEGRPRHILTDEATGLLKAIPMVWPETPFEPAPCVFLCHYHLWKQAYEILRKHRLHGKKRKLRIALDKAFQSPENWVRFVILAERHMRFIPMPRLERWIKEKMPLMSVQLSYRRWPVSIGNLEGHLRDVKNSLFDRRYSFRNQERLNRLLMLMQLQQNKIADERRYARIIRETLQENEGHAFPRHIILDPAGTSSLRA